MRCDVIVISAGTLSLFKHGAHYFGRLSCQKKAGLANRKAWIWLTKCLMGLWLRTTQHLAALTSLVAFSLVRSLLSRPGVHIFHGSSWMIRVMRGAGSICGQENVFVLLEIQNV